ncbi:MAG TPA: hypothetical protein PL105_12220 [Caldilineaceae bacterium]|nr:hypothetical protein [Caldilineaceae bacterium]
MGGGEQLPPGAEPKLADGQTLVAVVTRQDGQRVAVIDRPMDAFIRGLHYTGEGENEDARFEDEPPAGDLLNPDAVDCFIRLVYDRFATRFRQHFGSTVIAIFTDEPSPVGRPRERGIWPGTTGILPEINRILGYDFTPHLPALWYDDEPDAAQHRAEYTRAIGLRMEEVWYQRLHDWCQRHDLPLTGHPAEADDLGAERYFHIPGQDLVWRWVLPDHPSSLEGRQSTQGKCASSAMIHLGRRRNLNELCGAYGHGLTWAEMNWLADWCFIRGANLLVPHAFYYSIRGIRRDERPPDVGPNSPWWDRYPVYAARCARLSWLNTDSQHICHTAILGASDHLPWQAAKVLFQHQRDFNYLEERHLWEDAQVDETGIRIAGMHYAALILDQPPHPSAAPALALLEESGRLIRHAPDIPATQLVARLDPLVPPDVTVHPPAPGLRVRHIHKDGMDVRMLFNERSEPLATNIHLAGAGALLRVDPATGERVEFVNGSELSLVGYELVLLVADTRTAHT